MSSRKLIRMKPEEIQCIIDTRTGEITEREEALSRLEARKKRAKEIADAFGYKPHMAAMEKETIAVPADVVLLKALTQLGIRPLDRNSVMRYQKAMTRRIFNLVAKGLGFPLFFSGLLCAAIVLIGAVVANESLGETISVHAIWGVIFGLGCFLLWAEHTIIPRREWDVRDLEHAGLYSNRSALIPNSVFEIALAVRKELSKAEFVVHQLNKEYGSMVSIDPDPFLEVRFAGESYFIAVWDESGFDGKLMEVE